MHPRCNKDNWLPFFHLLSSLLFFLLSEGQQMHCPLLWCESQYLILILNTRMHILFDSFQINLIIRV